MKLIIKININNIIIMLKEQRSCIPIFKKDQTNCNCLNHKIQCSIEKQISISEIKHLKFAGSKHTKNKISLSNLKISTNKQQKNNVTLSKQDHKYQIPFSNKTHHSKINSIHSPTNISSQYFQKSIQTCSNYNILNTSVSKKIETRPYNVFHKKYITQTLQIPSNIFRNKISQRQHKPVIFKYHNVRNLTQPNQQNILINFNDQIIQQNNICLNPEKDLNLKSNQQDRKQMIQFTKKSFLDARKIQSEGQFDKETSKLSEVIQTYNFKIEKKIQLAKIQYRKSQKQIQKNILDKKIRKCSTNQILEQKKQSQQELNDFAD